MPTVEDTILRHPLAARFECTPVEIDRLFTTASCLPAGDRSLLQPFLRDRPYKFFDRAAFKCAAVLFSQVTEAQANSLSASRLAETTEALRFLRATNATWRDTSRTYDHHVELRAHRLHAEVFAEYSRLAEHILGALLALLVELSAPLRQRPCTVPHDLRPRWEMARSKAYGLDSSLTDSYSPTVRNAIVHGGVTLDDWDVVFRDDSGSSETLPYADADRMAERLLDTCNGINAAFVQALAFGMPIAKRLQLWGQTERAIALARAPLLFPEASYITTHANGLQAEMHGTHGHWRHDHLILDLARAAVALKESIPGATRYFLSFRSREGAQCFYGLESAEIPDLAAPSESLQKLGKALTDGQHGMAWVEHQRVLPALVGKTFMGPWLNWIDAVDRSFTEVNYELRELKDISVGRRLRFRACVVSAPRATDLDEKGKPTLGYLQSLFSETMFRWLLRAPERRPLGSKRLRFPTLGIVYVYHGDRRRLDLEGSGLGDNLLFQMQFGLRTGPPFLDSVWERIGLFHVNLNKSGHEFLRRLKAGQPVAAGNPASGTLV